jgi:sigma-E factor negative regulatory protein RseC
MLVETGQVQKVSKPGWAHIVIRRASSCKSCSARGACMTLDGNERSIEVRDPVGAHVGDEVQIGIQPSKVVWASTIAYIFPVFGMIAGAVLGMEIAPEGSQDLFAAGCSFGALALCFAAIWIFDRFIGDREARAPIVLRVVGSPNGETETG